MSEDTNNSGNSTPPPAMPPGIQVPESFYTKAIKPILGKLILAGVILILLIIVVNIFLKSLKKDHTLELMNQKLEMLEKDRGLEIKIRQPLEKIIKESQAEIAILKNEFEKFKPEITSINDNIAKIKFTFKNEKVKEIQNYGSGDLLDYYHKLPEPNDY